MRCSSLSLSHVSRKTGKVGDVRQNKYIPTMVSVYIVKKNIVIYTHIAASGGKIQTLLVYHRTVVILKSLKSVVKFRYIETGLVL